MMISIIHRHQTVLIENILLLYSSHFCLQGGPHILTNMSSSDTKAKKGDVVNLLCSAQGESPITFYWKKDQKTMKSSTEMDKPHRSSFLVLTIKDEASFGKYICHIRDSFQSATHTVLVQKDEGNNAIDIS